MPLGFCLLLLILMVDLVVGVSEAKIMFPVFVVRLLSCSVLWVLVFVFVFVSYVTLLALTPLSVAVRWFCHFVNQIVRERSPTTS